VQRPTLALAGLALALALAACGGTTDTPTDPAGEGELPSAEQLGDCLPDETDCGPDAPEDPAAEDPAAEDCEVTVVDCNDAVEEGEQVAGMCAEGEPDCVDTIDPNTSTCLAGAEDCADDPSGGQDMARPLLVGVEPPDGEPLPSGTSDMAQGVMLSQVGVVDDTTLRVQLDAGACDVLQDVVVQESDTEVRLLVLVGPERGGDACTQQVVTYVVDVALDAPLADRAVLDLGG